MKTSEIIKIVDKYQVISFDLFDTLLKREVLKPTDIFEVVETSTGIIGYRQKRIEAEKIARKKTLHEEVNIDVIYDYLSYDYNTKVFLKNKELNVEKEFLTSNPQLCEIYRYAISKGKIVLIVSDTYFPRNFIESVLDSNCIERPNGLYLSSEYTICKNTGHLFDLIVKENLFDKHKILHIGDSVKSDYLIPKLKGISALHINTFSDHLLYLNKSGNCNIGESILISYINNHVYGSRLFQIGYQTIGPLLAGFCNWIHSIKVKKGLDSLLFMSRDGFLIFQAYRQLFPDENAQYIYVSRRSLTVPLLHKEHSLTAMLDIIPLYFYTSVYTVIERLGLEYKKIENVVSKYGLSGDMQFTKEEFLSNPDFLKLFIFLESEIRKNSKREYDSLIHYLNSLNIHNQVGIVDLGWNGTIQKALEKIMFQEGFDVSLFGLYIGITLDSTNAFGYIFNSQNAEYKIKLMGFKSLLELLLSANHGSLLRYYERGCEFYDFEFDKNSKTRQDYQVIKEIQNGAISFVAQIPNTKCFSYVDWRRDLAFMGIAKLGVKPIREDLVKLGNLSFFDNDMFYLAKPQILKYRSFSKYLKKDFSPAPWKLGYLRRLLRIPLPYLNLYRFMRFITKK